MTPSRFKEEVIAAVYRNLRGYDGMVASFESRPNLDALIAAAYEAGQKEFESLPYKMSANTFWWNKSNQVADDLAWS